MVKKKKETVEFKKDEGPRPGTTVESLAKLAVQATKADSLQLVTLPVSTMVQQQSLL